MFLVNSLAYNFVYFLYNIDNLNKSLEVFITFLPGKTNWAFDLDLVKIRTRWLSEITQLKIIRQSKLMLIINPTQKLRPRWSKAEKINGMSGNVLVISNNISSNKNLILIKEPDSRIPYQSLWKRLLSWWETHNYLDVAFGLIFYQ